MKWIKYSRFTPEDIEISSEDLLRALSEFFLSSGFDNPYYPNPDRRMTFQELKQAIEQAMYEEKLFDEDKLQQIRDMLNQMSQEELDKLVNRLAQQLVNEGFVQMQEREGGTGGDTKEQAQLEVTDKSVDFLGFKTLKDLLGSLGKASFGAHDTRDLATGVESSGAARQYEFGDTLNLDVGQTLFSAIKREGLGVPLNLEYQDLHVH